MPFYYEINRAETSNGSGGTESSHFWTTTVANQESCAIKGILLAARGGTAGGAQFRAKTNTGTIASGGTSQTPGKANIRGNPAAQTTWFNDGSAITAGTTLLIRLTVGFAQTGGMGGWQAMEPADSIQLMPNAVSPVDGEFTSICNGVSVPFDATIRFSEGT